MDPLSTASASGSISLACHRAVEQIYMWVNQAKDIDEEFQSFGSEVVAYSRVLSAVDLTLRRPEIAEARDFGSPRETYGQALCKELCVLSLVDGAHGIGHIDLAHLGKVSPDFVVSNCHKWLYVPRGCAVFHAPARNQYLIRSSIPTSYASLDNEGPNGKPQFVNLFDFVANMDHSPYTINPEAIRFRKEIGGEEVIRNTDFMDNENGTLSQCAFANVRLRLKFKSHGKEKGRSLNAEDAGKVQRWIKLTAFEEADTYLQLIFYAGSMWVRLSGQIYVGLKDFELAGDKLKELCDRLNENPRLIDWISR
ncbi:hypothetical protein N431DRAFT_473824 [Stipitochalara longipes BDJ]|nr:hypothetical protein N431DRAFT_473824 [Stipitochalara longipes BDJ]